MTADKKQSPIDPLDLLRLLGSQAADDDEIGGLASIVFDKVIAEVERLREIETAALVLADMVLADTGSIELPTADSPIIQTIRGCKASPKRSGVGRR